MWRFLSGPKALLPAWLLAALTIVGTVVGCAAYDAGAPTWLAVVITAFPSWVGGFVARRWLAGRGETAFEELPSARSEYGHRSLEGLNADLLGLGACVVIGAHGYLAARALGVGERPGGLGGAPEILALAAALPAWFEADARYALRLRRSRQAEEQMLEAGPAPPAAPTATVRPPSGERLGDMMLTIPLDRVGARTYAAGGIAGAGAVVAAAAGLDLSAEAWIAAAVLVPSALYRAWVHLAVARKPYFLRLTREGADLLGAGTIPWEAVLGARVEVHYRLRRLVLVLRRPVSDQPWATPDVRRLAKHAYGGANVRVLLLYSAWPAVAVTAALREEAGVVIDADLAD